MVHPLFLPADNTSYFALDNVAYHGHNISIGYDYSGVKNFPDQCRGLCVWVDGKLKARAPTLTPLNVSLAPG